MVSWIEMPLLALPKHPSTITQAPFCHHPSTLLPSSRHPSCIAQAPFLLCGNIHLAVQNNLNCGAIQLILPSNSICFAVQINSFCIREGFFLQRTDVHPVMQKGVLGTAKKTVRQRWKDWGWLLSRWLIMCLLLFLVYDLLFPFRQWQISSAILFIATQSARLMCRFPPS